MLAKKLEELKPCPFCGSDVQIAADAGAKKIICDGCGVNMICDIVDGRDDVEVGIEKWNRRKSEPLRFDGYDVEQLRAFRAMLIEHPEVFSRISGKSYADVFAEGMRFALENLRTSLETHVDEINGLVYYRALVELKKAQEEE